MAGIWEFTLTEGLELIEDHSDQAVGYIREIDKGKPRYEALLRIIADRWQVVENLVWQLATERSLDDAIGVQLDGIGDILDELRGSKTDDQYRLILRAKVLVLRSDGTLPKLIEILDVLGVKTDVRIWQYSPASLMICVFNTNDGEIIGDLMSQAKVGGVALRWIWSPDTEDKVFRWASTLGADEADATRGFGVGKWVHGATI